MSKTTNSRPGRGHNSAMASPLERSADRILTLVRSHAIAGAESLSINIEIGVELRKAKQHFATAEEFIAWAGSQAGVKRRQVYNLLKLAQHAEDLRAAIQWVVASGVRPEARWYYIDGARDLLAAHAVATGKAGAARKVRPRAKGRREPPTIRLRRIVATLLRRERLLAAAMADVGATAPSPTAEEVAALGEAEAEAAKLVVDLAKLGAAAVTDLSSAEASADKQQSGAGGTARARENAATAPISRTRRAANTRVPSQAPKAALAHAVAGKRKTKAAPTLQAKPARFAS